MRNINAEYDEQSNDFQRSVNYDETQHNTTQHNIASIPYVLETDSTLEELAIKLGYSIDDLLALNPQYAAADKITANTSIYIPQPSTPQNTTNEHNTNYTSGSIVEIYQPTEEEKEEDAWWDWITSVVVDILIEVATAALEIGLEATGLDIVITLVQAGEAFLSGDPDRGVQLLADAALKTAEKFIPGLSVAINVIETIKTMAELTVAASEGNFEKVGGILAEEVKNKVAQKTTQKIQKQVETWKTEKQEGKTPVIPSPKKSNSQDSPTVIVNASLDKVKDDIEKRKIELEQNKLPIPERELIENKVEPAPVLKTKEEKPKQEKPKQDEQKKLRDTEASNTERLTAIDRDKDYLSAADKAIFDQVVNEKYSTTNPEQIKQRQDNIAKLEGKINSQKKQLLKIGENIKNISDKKDREVFENRLKNTKTPEDITALLRVHTKYEKLTSAQSLTLTLEEKEGKIKFPTALEQRQNLVAAFKANKPISPADFEPITQKEKDNKVAEYRAYQKELAFRADTTNKKATPWANTNYENTGITNLQKHTPQEKETATQKVQNFFDQKKAQDSKWTKAKNIGYIDGQLKYQNKPLILDKSIQTSVSKDDLKSNPELQKLFDTNIFDAKQVSSDGYSRPLERIDPNDTDSPFLPMVTNYRDARHDSEYLMLTRAALDIQKQTGLKITKGSVYKGITGNLTIVSSNDICPSCQNIVLQFNQMFPNITLTIIDKIIPVDTNKNLKK